MAGIGAATIYTTTVLFSLLVLGLYILGGARYLTNLEDNTCEMTFMFEYPQYVKIALRDDIEDHFPRFGLFAYGEGFITEKLRRMKFSGIPVLFIPGNGGSHEQVRSLASVSLRMSIKDRTPFHFDYFTVSLGKDYSALYGGVLEEETTYVSICIMKILSLYKGKVDNVVLIGHSMGGIIAKGALMRLIISGPNPIGGLVSILITLASPHRPIFMPDRTIMQYFEKLENSTQRLRGMGTSVVSIGGGQRDVLVSSSQTIEPAADLNVISSGMPDVWQSTDHLCILWCKKFVLTVVRALFDAVDTNARPPAITSNSRDKLTALSYHFTNRVSGKRLQPYEERVVFESGAEWIEDIRRQYTWTSSGRDADNSVFLMIRLGFPSFDSVSIEAVNLESKDWLFACSAHAIEGNSRVCEWGWNLTNRTSLSPDPTHRLRKSVDLHSEDLNDPKISHIVVRLPSSELRTKKSPIKIHVDLYKRADRTLYLKDENRGVASLNLFRLSRILSPDPQGIVESPRGSLRYHVVLTDIEDAVGIDIEPKHEVNSTPSKWMKEDELPQAIFELLEDSINRTPGQVRTVVLNRKDSELVRKRLVMHATKKGARLRITLGPEYSYRLLIRRAGIVERVACAARNRWPTLYPIIIALCLLSFAMRIDHSRSKTTITIGATIVGSIMLDLLLEIFVALGLLHVFAVTICALVVFFGSVIHNIAARLFSRVAAMPSVWFDWIIGGIDRVPILTTFIFLSLVSATCGAAPVLITLPLQFLKLTRKWDEYLEELFLASLRHFIPFGERKRKRKRRGAAPSSTTPLTPGESDAAQAASGTQTAVTPLPSNGPRESILNKLLVFVTWSFVVIPAIPSALVWAKHFRYGSRLMTEDPVMLTSWVILTCWGALGLVEIHAEQYYKNGPKRRVICCNLLRLIAWLLIRSAGMPDSARYQWLVPPLATIALSAVALLSLFPGIAKTGSKIHVAIIPGNIGTEKR